MDSDTYARMADETGEADPNSKFNISSQKLVDIIEAYRKRKYDEEITLIEDEIENSEELARKICSDTTNGICQNDFEERDAYYGSNQKLPVRRRNFCTIIYQALDDLMLKILIVAAIVSFIVNFIFDEEEREMAWVDSFGILSAVIIVSIAAAWSDYKSEEKFIEQTEFSDSQNNVTVIRNAEKVIINYDEIKVGDLIEINVGMNIPCDALLIRGSGVITDESSLTGESRAMNKEGIDICFQKILMFKNSNEFRRNSDQLLQTNNTTPSPVLLSGTQIETGEGYFMAIVVGEKSSSGKIKSKLSIKQQTTPLKEKLEVMANDIGKFAIYGSILIICILMLRFFIQKFIYGFNWKEHTGDYIRQWFDYLIIGVALVVAVLPEGLPLAVIISLAYSLRKMIADNNLVKKMASCETMGSATNILCDKTGTLTKNQMFVTNFWVNNFIILNPDHDNYHTNEHIPNQKVAKLFFEN